MNRRQFFRSLLALPAVFIAPKIVQSDNEINWKHPAAAALLKKLREETEAWNQEIVSTTYAGGITWVDEDYVGG